MSLTDAQIDRYSRQIIVPRIGGRGQERLLRARMLIAGDARDIEAPLAYLIGAGIGTICVKSSAGKVVTTETNRDVSTIVDREMPGDFDLALLIVGSQAALKTANWIVHDRNAQASVVARLDTPGKIAVIPRANISLDASMLAVVGKRSDAADFIAMLATTEAFKLLVGYDENPHPMIIEFDGYATTVRALP